MLSYCVQFGSQPNLLWSTQAALVLQRLQNPSDNINQQGKSPYSNITVHG